MSKIVQIMRALRTMPPLPEVASRILKIARDPEYSIDGLVAVVRTDPALTTRILKLCNSSLFGLSQEITSVSDAVAYLGTRNLVKLALVSCSESYFKGMPQNAYADPTELWRHTLGCATAAQALAEACGNGQPETAFTAGILHNIGRIAIVQVMDEATLAVAAERLMDPDASPLDVEREVFGVNHAVAGGIVAEHWKLPTELRRATRNHHDPAMLVDDDPLTALLHVADETVMAMGVGDPQPLRAHAPRPAALTRLGLQEAHVTEVRETVTKELERLGKLLNPEPRVGR